MSRVSVVALFDRRHFDLIKPVGVAVMVEKVARAINSVGNELQAFAQQLLGGVDLGAHHLVDGVDPVALHQLVKPPCGDIVGRDHRLEVEPDDMGQPRHAHDHLPDVFAQHAAFRRS